MAYCAASVRLILYAALQQRRTVRDCSDRLVPRVIIEDCLRAPGTVPNDHPLIFCTESTYTRSIGYVDAAQEHPICVMLHKLQIQGALMSIGHCGRIVIEVETGIKRELYSTLRRDGMTLKEWFLKASTHTFLIERKFRSSSRTMT